MAKAKTKLERGEYLGRVIELNGEPLTTEDEEFIGYRTAAQAAEQAAFETASQDGDNAVVVLTDYRGRQRKFGVDMSVKISGTVTELEM